MSTGSTLRCSPSSSSSSSSPPAPPAAPPSRLRRMASLTQCFRPSRQPPAEAAAARPPPPKRTFYVPTHAAASFARTAAPPPPPRTIPEDDEATACPSSSRRPGGPRGADDDGAGDYAAFLADAEARDRARRPAGWTPPGPGCDAGAARQRDSAYYSAGSRSSASAPRPPAQHRALPSPCPAHAGRTLRRQPSATLGRRISQYIKPPREDDVAEVG